MITQLAVFAFGVPAEVCRPVSERFSSILSALLLHAIRFSSLELDMLLDYECFHSVLDCDFAVAASCIRFIPRYCAFLFFKVILRLPNPRR